MDRPLLIYILLLVSSAFFLLSRLLTILNPARPKPFRPSRRHAQEPTHLLIVLGSGGHTAEMLAMLERSMTEPDHSLRLDLNDFRHRTWIVSSGDALSAERARDFERRVDELYEQRVSSNSVSESSASSTSWSEGGRGTFDIQTVPRAREIHQSLLTAPASCLRCFVACVMVLSQYTGGPGELDFPDLILVNGPATGTIVVLASLVLRFFEVWGCNWKGKMRTIYVESWARVKRLSLSGRLLESVVDRFLVQWPQLERPGGRAEFVGVLV
ncbi:glycosyltransferase family 1 protein [Sphaerulina musiva SO2202]|uniref:UDP-N-acetylglucosamine transferase subunit ALG14 n=1 Tax=Sphaerulina musiva (strain SO2202) TaxID=692275 RepID=M3CXW5_SPHMS|nr:glycosyltransferase family 1 protein [Sphaerulina musiva SO2202]EMF08516.1 glycosyltransferase family 1 protein [Sphaerulina musiva SO2202]